MQDNNSIGNLKQLYWWSFASRVIAGVLGWYLTKHTSFSLMEDSLFYDTLAGQIARDWLAGDTSTTLQSAIEVKRPWLMIILLASVYYLLDGAQLTPIGILVYSLITSFTAPLIYRIAIQIEAPEKAARIAGWLIALSPSFVFWSGALYKEGLLLAIMSLGFYHVLLLQSNWSSKSLLIVIVCCVGLYAQRFYLALILACVFAIGMVFARGKHVRQGFQIESAFRQLFVAGLFVVGILTIGAYSGGMEVIPVDVSEGLGLMQSSRNDLAKSARSGYLEKVDIRTPEKAIAFLPFGVAYFMTVPWPWESGTTRQLVTMPETAIWILLYFPALSGMKRGLQRNFQGSFSLILACIAITLFYSLWISNSGAAYRLRIQVWVFLSIFIGWGLCKSESIAYSLVSSE